MKKNVFGRKLKRDIGERKALFKNLMSSLILHERIQTTEEKAKSIKPEIEKLVTKAKKGGNASLNIIKASLLPIAYEKFITNVAPRFIKRNGGYTRIVRLNQRLGDQAQMVMMEWVEVAQIVPVTKQTKEVKKAKSVKKTPPTAKKTAKKSLAKPTKTKSKKAKK